MGEWVRTQEVRRYLAIHPVISDDTARFLEYMLPETWQRLIRLHGYQRVFDCLRDGCTEGGAAHRLL